MTNSFEISNTILTDLNGHIEKLNKNFNPTALINYFNKLDDKFSCKWPILGETDFPPEKMIVHRLGTLAKQISKVHNLDWMTFMIQNPNSSEFYENPFIVHNFGIREIAKRRKWNSWVLDKDTFTFTSLFFLRVLPVQAYSKIFCVRIERPGTSVPSIKDANFIVIDIHLEKGRANIIDVYCEKDIQVLQGRNGEIAFGEILIEHLEEMIEERKTESKSYESDLADYIKSMEEFTNLGTSFAYLYAIPVLSSFLYPANPSRSGLYLASKEPIPYSTIQQIQETITQSLCHIDYVRGAMIQREKDFDIVLHDIDATIRILKREIKNSNLDDQSKNRFYFISLVINSLKTNNMDILKNVLDEEIENLVGEDWLTKIALFSRDIVDGIIRIRTLYSKDIQPKIVMKNCWHNLRPSKNKPEITIFLILVIIILRNAWKHQVNYCREVNSSPELGDYSIKIVLSENDTKSANGRLRLFVTNKSKTNPFDKIRFRRSVSEGTYAVLERIQAMMYIENPFEVSMRHNFCKEEFTIILDFPNYWSVSKPGE